MSAPASTGPASPCVSLCRMNARTGYCDGCWRTLDEIACWGGADDQERLAILARVRVRRTACPAPAAPSVPPPRGSSEA